MSVRGDVTFEAGGKKYTARCGMLAWEALEDHFDLPFAKVIPRVFPDLSAEDQLDPAKVLAAATSIRHSDLSVFFEAVLKHHHGGLTRAEVADLFDGIGLGEASRVVGEAVRNGQDTNAEGGGSADGNPPKPRRKKKTS